MGDDAFGFYWSFCTRHWFDSSSGRTDKVSPRSVESSAYFDAKTRHYPKISPEQRLSRLTIAASIVLLSVTLLLLPQVVIVLGGFQTANSSLMLDDAFMPIWVYLVQALFSFVGMYALLLLGVYFRLVFSFSKKV